MAMTLFERLTRISPWHFIWISIVSAEIFTFLLSSLLGSIFWGRVSRETLLVGAVDALIVPLIITPIAIYFVRNITRLQLTNEQLAEANRRLQEIDRMKSEYLSVVSHEFRTPLATIKAFAEIIAMKPDLPEERRTRLLGTINNESERLTRLITDLLDLATIEAGSVRWRSEELSIADVIRDSLEGTSQLIETRALSVTTNFDPALPLLHGDRDRLVQVVTNLLSNAAKFTQPGGAIHIAARQEPSRVIVDIADTGRGIPTADLDRIFDKFHRSGDPEHAGTEGTGLGLAIVRHIVEHHGGRIWASSDRGKGSTFSFTLPLSAPVQGERV